MPSKLVAFGVGLSVVAVAAAVLGALAQRRGLRRTSPLYESRDSRMRARPAPTLRTGSRRITASFPIASSAPYAAPGGESIGVLVSSRPQQARRRSPCRLLSDRRARRGARLRERSGFRSACARVGRAPPKPACLRSSALPRIGNRHVDSELAIADVVRGSCAALPMREEDESTGTSSVCRSATRPEIDPNTPLRHPPCWE
jgi:hypothetical protein